MAWYYGTYVCGHEGRTNVIGPTRNRQWIADRHFEKLCEECYEKKREEDIEKANLEAAEKAEEMELPELTGSEKQIVWATTLRQTRIDQIQKGIDRAVELKADKALEEFNGVLDFMLMKKTDAKYYIDSRYDTSETFYRELVLEYRRLKEVDAIMPKSAEVEIKTEATVYPENQISNIVAEVGFENDTVYVDYPSKNEELRLLVKELRFRWCGGRWERKLVRQNGNPQDRIAEVGNKLLFKGFPIRIYDDEARNMAINANYEPEYTRWVLTRTKGDYAGWLALVWDKEEDFYDVARRLRGSKYSKPSVVVPPESYEEILDFAKMYDFKISPTSLEVIQKAKDAREAALVVAPATPETTPEKTAPLAKPQKLEVPEGVEIDDELLDND